MLIAVIARDKPGHLQLRRDTREAHLAYIADTGVVRMAGPLLDNGQMAGSLIVLEGESVDDAHAWLRNDPYSRAGLFESVTVAEWKKVIG